jgi:dTDP-glucose pyrophosphorylase
MLNIVIPMAGLGSRFSAAGYEVPKPLIRIHGVPMIRVVIENLRPRMPHRFIFICQKDHAARYDLRRSLAQWADDCEVIELHGLTQGAACTVLTARDLIDNDQPLMIANSDQFIDASIDDYLADLTKRDLDGMIMTMPANDPKWSFASLDQRGMVTRVAEKDPISRHATVGIYNYRCGGDFVAGADRMIAKEIRTAGEFYVAPVYNELIAQRARIGTYDIGPSGMHGLGTPSDLETFLALDLSETITEGLPC